MPTATKKKKSTKPETKTVHLSFLIDESGSMSGNRMSVIEGYNEFVRAMAAEEGADIKATLALFDTREKGARVQFDAIPIREVPTLTPHEYRPSGMTPLNDAVYSTIAALEAKVAKGERALCVIVTDGMENASTEVTADQVAEKIAEREADDWAFIYLGADHDAWDQGGSIGVPAGQTFGYTSTPSGTRSAFAAATNMGVGYLSDNDTMRAVASATPSHIPADDAPDPTPPPAHAPEVKAREGSSVEDAIDAAKGVLR
jgi:uncharacterized protein YegL